MIQKKFSLGFTFLAVCSILLLCSCGLKAGDTSALSPQDASLIPSSVHIYTGDGERIDDEGTKAYKSAENNFILTVPPIKIQQFKEGKRITYSLTVENATDAWLNGYCTTLQLDERLDPYIAAGVMPMSFMEFDMAPKNFSRSEVASDDYSAKGEDMTWGRLIATEDFLSSAELNYEDIYTYGASFTAVIKWDGGVETHVLTAEVIDETIQ